MDFAAEWDVCVCRLNAFVSYFSTLVSDFFVLFEVETPRDQLTHSNVDSRTPYGHCHCSLRLMTVTVIVIVTVNAK